MTRGTNGGRHPVLTAAERAQVRAEIEATRALRAATGNRLAGDSYEAIAQRWGVSRAVVQDVATGRTYVKTNPRERSARDVPCGTPNNSQKVSPS